MNVPREEKIGGGAGRGVGPDGLPVHQIGAGLDHDGLIGKAVEGEAEAARFHARAARDARPGLVRGRELGGASAVCAGKDARKTGRCISVLRPQLRERPGMKIRLVRLMLTMCVFISFVCLLD